LCKESFLNGFNALGIIVKLNDFIVLGGNTGLCVNIDLGVTIASGNNVQAVISDQGVNNFHFLILSSSQFRPVGVITVLDVKN